MLVWDSILCRVVFLLLLMISMLCGLLWVSMVGCISSLWYSDLLFLVFWIVLLSISMWL